MATTDKPLPGVTLSWEEAVRVVPTIVATEAQRICDELEEAEGALEIAAKEALYAGNSKRDALIELGEALIRMDAPELQGVSHYPEYERIRYYVKKAMRDLGDKKALRDLGEKK